LSQACYKLPVDLPSSRTPLPTSDHTPPVGALHKSSLKTPVKLAALPIVFGDSREVYTVIERCSADNLPAHVKGSVEWHSKCPGYWIKNPTVGNVPPLNSSPTNIRTRPSTHTQGTLGSTSTARKSFRKTPGLLRSWLGTPTDYLFSVI